MSIAAGTVAHLVGQLLLAQEDLTREGELIFPPRNNHYREARLKELAVLAWDIAEAVEAEQAIREAADLGPANAVPLRPQLPAAAGDARKKA